MVVIGVVGILAHSLVHMELVCGKILDRSGPLYLYILEEAVSRFLVSCRFKNAVDKFEWAFTGVYGPNSDRNRRLLWEELSSLCNWWNMPWCVGGDFNIVQFPSEHSGCVSFTQAMHQFSDFIS